ncbi:hypothetical protein Hanom_Chr08g00694741 [Helianthus anomalus]
MVQDEFLYEEKPEPEHEQDEILCSPHSEQTSLISFSVRQYAQIPTCDEFFGCFLHKRFVDDDDDCENLFEFEAKSGFTCSVFTDFPLFFIGMILKLCMQKLVVYFSIKFANFAYKLCGINEK